MFEGLCQVRDNRPNIPEQYRGRWSFDYDEKRGFFVYCNGHGILQAEDSEVCDAVCRAHNAALKSEDEPLLD